MTKRLTKRVQRALNQVGAVAPLFASDSEASA